MTISKSYSFPSFYACYLLKSIHTPRTYRNYIGSTQDPVRRLRQHNGLIKQGAKGTAAYRPWVMQLLVHGFPSKPAATTFEYAWQHPHRTRYLRDNLGNIFFKKRGNRLEQNVLVLQKLIRTHPFSTWPLHVKLFTEEAVQCWDALSCALPLFSSSVHRDTSSGNVAFRKQDLHRYTSLFPPGFTYSIELEGVDGSSGLPGSGRRGPISVTDDDFTAPYLTKNTALIASGHTLKCSICSSPIHDYATNHLGTTLCTHTGCTSISHLTCLAKSWLEIERRPVSSSDPLPSPSSHSRPLHLPASSPHPPSSSVPSLSPRSPLTLTATTNLSTFVPASSFSNPFNLGQGMLPRGGTCTSCKNYTLWGDIVKGCFRRDTDGQIDKATLEEEEDESTTATLSRRARKPKSTTSTSSSDNTSLLPPARRRPGRPRRVVELKPTLRVVSKKRGRPRKEERTAVVAFEPQMLGGPVQARGPGRPRKCSPVSSPKPLPVASRRGPGRPRGIPSTPGLIPSTTVPRGPGRPKKTASVPPVSSSVGERRKPGRPRKIPLLPVEPPVISALSQPPSGLETESYARRRGRPRKNVIETSVAVGNTVDLSPTKRGPGRPKKGPTKLEAECKRKGDKARALIAHSKVIPGRGDSQFLSIVGAVKTQKKRGRPPLSVKTRSNDLKLHGEVGDPSSD